MGVLHQPHSVNRKMKRVSRLVILPDYQGIGIGYKFLCAVGKMYTEQGWTFTIGTSAKNLIHKLKQSDEWFMFHLGTHSRSKSINAKIDRDRSSLREVKTASFKYRG